MKYCDVRLEWSDGSTMNLKSQDHPFIQAMWFEKILGCLTRGLTITQVQKIGPDA